MYYQLDEKGDIYYEDAGHIDTYPELPRGVDLTGGERIDLKLDVPLRFRMDPEWGKDMTLMMGVQILLMRKDLIKALQEVGVDNLQLYDAVIENPYTGKDVMDYQAVNIIGLVAAADLDQSNYKAFSDPPTVDTLFRNIVIDESKTGGALMFRMAESVSTIIVHQRVKEHLEKRFPSLVFYPAGKVR